jgi:hypothetical protein
MHPLLTINFLSASSGPLLPTVSFLRNRVPSHLIQLFGFPIFPLGIHGLPTGIQLTVENRNCGCETGIQAGEREVEIWGDAVAEGGKGRGEWRKFG